MAGKLNIYNLGRLGVNTDKSPIHLEDGELMSSQNAQIDTVGDLGGIRKRDGMAKLNTTALAGSGTGIIGLPLPDRSTLTRWFYMPIDDNTGAASGVWRRSNDGTTWTTLAVGAASQPVLPVSVSQMGAFGTSFGPGLQPWISLNNKLYYPGNDYTAGTTAPTVHAFDGVNDTILAYVPQNPKATQTYPQFIASITPFSSTQLVVTTADQGAGVKGRVLLLNTQTGQLTQVGQETSLIDDGVTSSIPALTVSYLGKIYTASLNGQGGAASKVFWARPGDAVWTQETAGTSAAGNGYVYGMTVLKGNLYLAYQADVGINGLIRKRASDATYSTVYTSTSTTALNYVGALITNLSNTAAYAFVNTNDVTSAATSTADKQFVIRTTDGTTWTKDYDVGSNNNNSYTQTGYPVFDSNGDLYWPVSTNSGVGSRPTRVFKRTAAGVWSTADSAGANLHGQILRISF